jgi:hypothetical protein
MAKLELVVAIGGDDERGRRVDLAGQQAHDVETGLVGPVEVLEHEDRRRAVGELAQQRGRDLVRRRGAGRDLREVAADLLGDVEQRAERARREERVARAPQDPRRGALPVGEQADERRLARARLAGHQRQAPVRRGRDVVEHRHQRIELRRALQ